MKVILSHDVDHMTVWEHKKDLILPKFYVRACIELAKGKISFQEFSLRFSDLFRNKWQRIEELIEFHDQLGIKSTFFFGVNNGVGLNYSLKHVKKWAPIARDAGYEVGVHGIDYSEAGLVKREFERFKEIINTPDFGIRMHYLRTNEHTYSYMEQAGYNFDATKQGFENPYKIGEMWEFPLQIMDGWVMLGQHRYQSRNLEEAKKYTLQELEKAKKADLQYLSILFHDRYFCKQFATWKAWYEWLVNHLIEEGHEFVSHAQAIKELEAQK